MTARHQIPGFCAIHAQAVDALRAADTTFTQFMVGRHGDETTLADVEGALDRLHIALNALAAFDRGQRLAA